MTHHQSSREAKPVTAASYLFLAGLMFLATGCRSPGEPAGIERSSAALSTEVCPPGTRIIVGTEDNDVLVGTAGRDCILGLGGNDVIHGGSGDDVIVGGPGDDELHGGNGQDVLLGGDGADRLDGENGEDTIDAGEGNDVLEGGPGKDRLEGGGGNDRLAGGSGDDDVTGGPGADVVAGARGADTLLGEDGNDVVISDESDPLVDGGSGVDACAGPGCEEPPPVVGSQCDTDAICSDGNDCNGVEICAAGTCQAGTPSAGEAWFPDSDGDGWGGAVAVLSCGRPSGYFRASELFGTDDCNDASAAVNPGAGDATCDGADHDCDGIIDEDAGTPWYFDRDADGWAAGTAPVVACTAPEGGVPPTSVYGVGDCNDSLASVRPGISDGTCDGVDQDCDGQVDEDTGTTWYLDRDGDGWHDTNTPVRACTAPLGSVAEPMAHDCDDGNPAVHPAAHDDCDGRDDDCDGIVDQEFTPFPTGCGIGTCGGTGTVRCIGGAITHDCVPRPDGAGCGESCGLGRCEAGVCIGAPEGPFVPKSTIKLALSLDPAEGSSARIIEGFQTIGFAPTLYSFAEIEQGALLRDGINVLALTRTSLAAPVSDPYRQAVREYLGAGGGLLAEYDSAALLFSEAEGGNGIIPNLEGHQLELFAGMANGGGALLPLENSRMFITDHTHPVNAGMPDDVLLGVRAAFAITGFDPTRLRTVATFTSSGYMNLVPAGTYPAVLTTTCGPSRMVIFTMTHFQVIGQPPFSTMMKNSIDWVLGRE